MVQWIRICLPMQGTQVWSLVWKDPTSRGAAKPVCCNYWSPSNLETTLCKERSHCNEKPSHRNEEQHPGMLQLGKSLYGNKNPAQPKTNTKGNQSWMFIRRTDAEAETPTLWQPDVKNWLNGLDPDSGKDWKQERKGMAENETVWWHHWLNGNEFEQALGVGDGHGSLACCSPQGRRVGRDWTELNRISFLKKK